MKSAHGMVLKLLAVLLLAAAALMGWEPLTEPAQSVSSSSYEVLEPETWVGKELPIWEYIDMGEQLIKKGNWVILFYHHDCPDCVEAIGECELIAHNLVGNEDFLRIALIEVPPYGLKAVSQNSPCTPGRLANVKEWFITTPAVVLISDGIVNTNWETLVPDLETIVQVISEMQKQQRF